MRIASLLTGALATLATTRAVGTCPDAIGSDANETLPVQRGRAPTAHRVHRDLIDRLIGRASGQAFIPYSTQNGQCIDVQNNNLASGSRVQLWQCSGNGNQQWRIEGPLYQTGNDMCLDVPYGNAYNGAPLQVWKCNGQNPNQAFNQVGGTLRFNGANGAGYCVDVTNGNFNNGNLLQLWTCHAGSANQAFVGGQAQSQGSTNTGATTWMGYNCISLDDFVKKYPACAQWKGALQSAGADQSINPTFLGAISMIESGCNDGLRGSPNAKYGPFQFMDDGAWNYYGGTNKDRTNFWDAAYGAARYFKALLVQDHNNLYQVMRDYNGPIGQGGDPDYQNHAAAYMGGYA